MSPLEQRKSPRELFENALARIRQSLEETKTESCRRSRNLGIVDAGALGFYHFMDGFCACALLGGSYSISASAQEPARHTGGCAYLASWMLTSGSGNCTEGAPGKRRARTKKHCATIYMTWETASLLAGTDNLARIHLHTSRPWEMVRRIAAHAASLNKKRTYGLPESAGRTGGGEDRGGY